MTEATYERVNASDEWYSVMIGQTKVGEIFKTKKGWIGFALNNRHKRFGPHRLMKLAGNDVVGAWEAFPVAG